MIGTKVRATIGAKVIRNADKFFTNDTGDMLSEVVANARRADARSVSFGLRAEADGTTTMVVEDDGHGLAREAAAVLLTFGGSDNDPVLDRVEDAAGIGFFSLSAHDVLVESRDWAMEVPREAFTGGAEATLGDALPGAPARGLRLTVRGIERTPGFEALASGSSILRATRHSGLVARLSGTGADGVHEPVAFLDEVGPDVVSTLTRSGLGVTVRAVRRLGHKEAVSVNFFGKAVGVGAVALGDLSGSKVARIIGKGQGRMVEEARTSVRVLVDVHDARVLRLQLPHRNEVVRDAGFEAVRAFVLETVARLYAGEGEVVDADVARSNGLPVDHHLRAVAAHLGVAIPPPSVAVRAVAGREREDEAPTAVTVGEDAIETVAGERLSGPAIVAVGDTGYLRSLLAQAGRGAVVPGVALWDGADLARALDPDAHARVVGVALEVRVEGGEDETDPTDIEGPWDLHDAITSGDVEDLVGTCVEALALRFDVEGPDGERAVRLPVPAVHFCGEGEDTSDPLVIATREADVGRVVDAMVMGLEWYSDDPDSPGREEQEEYVRADYAMVVSRALGRGDENFLAQVATALEDVAWRFAAVGTEVSLSVRIVREQGMLPRVVVERAAPVGAEAEAA